MAVAHPGTAPAAPPESPCTSPRPLAPLKSPPLHIFATRVFTSVQGEVLQRSGNKRDNNRGIV
eukprot:7793522-Pyramimonas_sp.AAC.2